MKLTWFWMMAERSSSHPLIWLHVQNYNTRSLNIQMVFRFSKQMSERLRIFQNLKTVPCISYLVWYLATVKIVKIWYHPTREGTQSVTVTTKYWQCVASNVRMKTLGSFSQDPFCQDRLGWYFLGSFRMDPQSWMQDALHRILYIHTWDSPREPYVAFQGLSLCSGIFTC